MQHDVMAKRSGNTNCTVIDSECHQIKVLASSSSCWSGHRTKTPSTSEQAPKTDAFCLPKLFSKRQPSVFKANNQQFGLSRDARKTFASFTCATTEPSQLSQVCDSCRKTQMGIQRAAWTEKSYLRRRAGEAEAEEGLEDALVLLLRRPAHAVVTPRPQQEAHQLPRQLVQRHRQTRLGGSSEKKSGAVLSRQHKHVVLIYSPSIFTIRLYMFTNIWGLVIQ